MRDKGVGGKGSARSPRQSPSVDAVPVPGAGTLRWARVRGHLRVYRPGQRFGSFPSSPAGFRRGRVPRGREQGRSPSPGSAEAGGSTQGSPGSPPALPAGGRGEAGGGRPSAGLRPPAPAYKAGLEVPGRRLPRRAPAAPGAAVGEVLGGERVPRDASPRGSPLSALVPLCTPLQVPGPAWRPQNPPGPGACPSEASPAPAGVGSAPAPLCAPRCPVLRSSAAVHCADLQAEPPFAFRGAGAAPGVRQKVSDPPFGASRALGPPPAPARRSATGTLPHVGEGQPRCCPPPAPQGSGPSSRGGQASSRRPPPTTTGSSRPALGAGGGGQPTAWAAQAPPTPRHLPLRPVEVSPHF